MLPDVPPPGHRHRPRPLAQDAAREHGYTAIGGPVPEGSDGDRLLEKLGYHVRWTSWVLQLPEGADGAAARRCRRATPIRAATPDDYEAVWNVVEDAFLEWSVREREPSRTSSP